MTNTGLVPFDRYRDEDIRLSRIGEGAIGGKAAGLLAADPILTPTLTLSGGRAQVAIPRCTVLATDLFDQVMAENGLDALVGRDDLDDETIAHAFQRASLPAIWTGDIRALVQNRRCPLAVRSSSLLEDALGRPFAGVYGTKMIPNNDPDPNKRFLRLTEAVKFVYASTYFQEARHYRRTLGLGEREEKMAVIVQEMVGRQHGDRFYPHLSGVARSINFYPFAPARPEEGVVHLALGLGKTIVDGGLTYAYSPAHPKAPPPHGSIDDMLTHSQRGFWAVHLGAPPSHDPIREAEFLREHDLLAAEEDGALASLVSTYDVESDRLVPGTYKVGPRVLSFAPILQDEEYPLNDALRQILAECEAALQTPVELELAANLGPEPGALEIGFLQVRPLVVSATETEITDAALASPDLLIRSDQVLGNGEWGGVQDLVYVRPEGFEARHTRAIAQEISRLNAVLVEAGAPYLLVGFGRWGSSDPWLGIPVVWSDISGAQAIVEATTSGMMPDFSQGSHFFHNLSSFEVSYFLVRHSPKQSIDWEWLAGLPSVSETPFVRHVRAPRPLRILVDGRVGQGVVLR